MKSRKSLLLSFLCTLPLSAQQLPDAAQIAGRLADAQLTLLNTHARASGPGWTMLQAVVRDCDSAPEPTPGSCAEVWDWYGAELQRNADPDTIRPLEAYYRKAVQLSQASLAPPSVQALSLELESMAIGTLGDSAKQKELWDQAAVLRRRMINSPEASAENAQPTVRVGGNVTQPHVIYKIDPAYAEIARLLKYSGAVTLAIVVSADGDARNITLVKGLGFGLDEQAVAAVKQWRFEPGTKDGNPVNVRATIQVNFKLL